MVLKFQDFMNENMNDQYGDRNIIKAYFGYEPGELYEYIADDGGFNFNHDIENFDEVLKDYNDAVVIDKILDTEISDDDMECLMALLRLFDGNVTAAAQAAQTSVNFNDLFDTLYEYEDLIQPNGRYSDVLYAVLLAIRERGI